MQRYIYSILCLIFYLIVFGLDYINNWPPADNNDKLILCVLITILNVMNYGLHIRFFPNNIYKDYKNLIILPYVPIQCFLKEFSVYIKSKTSLTFFIPSAIFFCYYMGYQSIKGIFLSALSIFIYFIFVSLALIIIRFICTYSIKGRNTFFTICLLINSIVMIQIILISNKASNFLEDIFLYFNPLNTLFFFSINKNIDFIYQIVTFALVFILYIFIAKKLTWETQLRNI